MDRTLRRLRELLELGERNPDAYRLEVARVLLDEPDVFRALVDRLGEELVREGCRPRRPSSMHALLRGDVDALVAKHRPRGARAPRGK